MKKINQRQANDEVRYFRIIATGECLYGLAFHWDAKVDLANKTYVSRFEENEYASSTLPSINELVANGTLELVNELEELYITEEDVDLKDFDAVVAYAKEQGFNIEREALEHNFKAWQMDYKSGYRGKECHIFTPCRHNPLSFAVSKLDERMDWQTTYIV